MPVRPARLRLQISVLAAIAAAFVAMLIAFDVHAPLVIYNASGSAPLGFYYLESRLPLRGEIAVVAPPPLVGLMITLREILPPGVPLVKEIAAVGGDRAAPKSPLARLPSTARSWLRSSRRIAMGCRCRLGRAV